MFSGEKSASPARNQRQRAFRAKRADSDLDTEPLCRQACANVSISSAWFDKRERPRAHSSAFISASSMAKLKKYASVAMSPSAAIAASSRHIEAI
jgi:hypothetical protein